MTLIAMMGQTLRVDDCSAFLRQAPGSWTVVVADRHGITQDDLPAGAHLVRLEVSPAPARGRLKSDLRRSALGLMRRGSSWGRYAENGLRRIKRVVAPADPSYDPMEGAEGNVNEKWMQTHTDELLRFLKDLHERDPIGEVVVFDLFDLPAALAFAEPRRIPLSVR